MWNLARLAECLLPLADKAALETTLSGFEPALHASFRQAILKRLGLESRGAEADGTLGAALWTFLATTRAPFEQTMFDLYAGTARLDRLAASPNRAFYDLPAFAELRVALDGFVPASGARPDHPYFQKAAPCTMLIDELEALWTPIAAEDDWSAFTRKVAAIRRMGEAYRGDGDGSQPG